MRMDYERQSNSDMNLLVAPSRLLDDGVDGIRKTVVLLHPITVNQYSITQIHIKRTRHFLIYQVPHLLQFGMTFQ